MSELNEPELTDDYPVYCGYLYIADGKLVSSDIEGNVRRLKNYLGAKVITRCDIPGRQAQEGTKP